MYLKQMHLDSAPSRAKAYKQVYNHYLSCSNKGTCQVCVAGAKPLLPPVSSSQKRALSSESAVAAASKKHKKAGGAPVTHLSAELTAVGPGDIRREGDALTHTRVDLTDEKKKIMLGAKPSLDAKHRRELNQLNSRKEDWSRNNLFDVKTLHRRIQDITKRHGVVASTDVTQCMSRALQDYLRQVLEDLVLCAQQRCNLDINATAQASRSILKVAREPSLTSKLHELYDQDFMAIQQKDRELRQKLLIDGDKDESLERERQKKRKKAKAAGGASVEPERVDPHSLDITELAANDLKKKITAERKKGALESIGGYNTSIPQPHQDSTVRNRITMEDATYYLTHAMPAVRPEIFCRAESANILTKSLL